METLFKIPDEEATDRIAGKGKPRIQRCNRKQIEMHYSALDDLLPEEHIARVIWEIVQTYDLSGFYDQIDAIEGCAGRPAIDPQILLGLWLLATVDGVGSARALERLCREQIGYQWMLGGVKVNYHTLADFRVRHEMELDNLLIKNIAAMLENGLVTLERTAQDGVRIRASAGAGSFRRRATLEKRLKEAKEYVVELKKQELPEESVPNNRRKAAGERAAKDRVERLKKSLDEIEKVEKQKAHSHKKPSGQNEARCSMTDPEARTMKMPDGGFRPAYNGQLCVDTASGIIVGVNVTNQVDQGQMSLMLEQIDNQYNQTPNEHLIDGGFVTHAEIEKSSEKGITVYAPIPKPRNPGQQPDKPRDDDREAVRAWRERMTTEVAKEIYKLRAATVELANAGLRNRRLYQLTVRGMQKARSVLLWFALVHNLLTVIRLNKNATV